MTVLFTVVGCYIGLFPVADNTVPEVELSCKEKRFILIHSSGPRCHIE
jgi:hypothetical protein